MSGAGFGAGAGAQSAGGGAESTVFKLEAQSELRFEVSDVGAAVIKIVEGTAEIFGVELAPKKEYTFSQQGASYPVFTWFGCTIEARIPREANSAYSVPYVSSDTPMGTYANVHQRLEARREAAEKTGSSGPRVMIVGPTDSGKSSLARILLTYAIRLKRTPLFVDLDIGQGEISVPGTISATALTSKCLDPQSGFVLTSPLVYFVGDTGPSNTNADLYKLHVESLAAAINKRVADPKVRAAGCVVNTCGWVKGLGKELLLHAARALSIDVVLVVGEDRLHAELKQQLQTVMVPLPPASSGDGSPSKPEQESKPVSVVKIARTGGVVTRSKEFRSRARQARLREYFNGHDGSLTPHRCTVSFDDVAVYRVSGHVMSSELLPIDQSSVLDKVTPTEVPLAVSLKQQILAVSLAADVSQLATANVAGFVHVKDVDVAKRQISFLAPSPGALPGRFLILGSITWIENATATMG